jgi:predicted amidohydrolase YtcJ
MSFGYLAHVHAHDDDDDNNGRDWHGKYKNDNDRDRKDRRCKGRSTDLGLINGRFLDPASGKVYRDLAIKDGRISSLSSVKGLEDGARIIDLKGKTAIPGLINMHVHHSRTGTTPDYEVRDIETAFSIREIQELIARRAKKVPAGRFVGCHLGWHYVQLAEGRPPTKAELNAASSTHPVYISGRAGWVEEFFSVVNSLGEAIFTAAGIAVDPATGKVVTATPEQCLAVINATMTAEDKLRQTWDNNAWSLSNGVVNILDPAGSPTTATSYPALELWRQGMLHVRHRLNYSSNTDVQVQTRAANIMRLMGDDLFRAGGFGESIGSRPVTSSTTFEPAAKAVAQAGWKLQNHTDFYEDVDFQLAAFQRIHAVIPLNNLRWQLIHCFQTTTAQLQALKDMGVGLDLENERYLDRLMRGGGPQYRQIVDSGIKCGAGTDGSNFAPNNPWLNIYYATTGVNVRGIPENAAQKITRLESLRMWTAGSAYQNFDDDKGVFEVGKVADIAVLSDNPLTCTDAKLRKMKSVLTIVGGKIVHDGDWPDYGTADDDFFYTGT